MFETRKIKDQRSAVYVNPERVKSDIYSQTSARRCGTKIWRAGYRVGCRPRHLITVQKCEVHPKGSYV
ncbi:hypothetical protein AVEN_141410-1, partial [Araneus ventricosus]